MRPRSDVQALSFSDNADITGQVVFVGYGLVVPEGQDFGYDSYAGLDVKDKVVLVLRYFPENADLKVKTVLARYSDLRYKAMAARQRGAKAMLVVTGPRSPNAGETIPMSFDTALAGSGIAAASISHAVAEVIFAAAEGKTLEATQQSLDTGNPHVAGFEIPGLTVTLHTAVAREKQVGRNIVAYLPATGGAPQATETVDRAWRALRPPWPWPQRQLSGAQGRGGADPFRCRRQRVGHVGRVGGRRGALQTAATAKHPARLLVG